MHASLVRGHSASDGASFDGVPSDDGPFDDGPFDDEPFDVAAVVAGAWVPGPYGAGDERGSYNEVTPETTAAALALLDLSRPVVTYNLSETLFEGFPTIPGRGYEQTLCITGWPAPDGFEGIVSPRDQPLGPWLRCSLEERVSTTYNMGTKINGLHHVGVNGTFYNGHRLDDIARSWGTTRLGNETQGPIVTRGVLIDVLGHKLVAAPGDCQQLDNGEHMLADGYRITVEDIEAALSWEELSRPIGPGDVVLIRTGWRQLIALDPKRYLEGRRPGPHLRECRYLAARRPAIIAMDSWKFGGTRPNPGEDMLPHQELPGKYRHPRRRGRPLRRPRPRPRLRVRLLLLPPERPRRRLGQLPAGRPRPAGGGRPMRTVALVAAVLIAVVAPATLAAGSAPRTQPIRNTNVVINGGRVGPAFQGIGAISGGGGNSRLLIDYPPQARRQILDYLFKPDFGASLQMLKIEIGGDADSTDGSEPSIEHAPGSIDCDAGYELWLAKQALALNPNIKIYGLQWAAPGWVRDIHGGLWSPADIDYLVDWLRCAQSEGVPVSYIGGWNEHYAPGNEHVEQWFEDLRTALDSNGFSGTAIVAGDAVAAGNDDQAWKVTEDMAADPAFDRAVAVIGTHDTCGNPTTGFECQSTPLARVISHTQKKPLWESELGATPATATNPAAPGPSGLARSLVNAFTQAGVTGVIVWPLLEAMPPNFPLEGRGLVAADRPWDGSFRVTPLTWVIAQTTQFVQPGWRFVNGANGQLACGCRGSYATYESPDRSAWSMVVQTSVAKTVQRVTVDVKGGLPSAPIRVWATGLTGGDSFVREQDAIAHHGVFTTDLLPGYVYTFTTTTGQSKAGNTAVPNAPEGPMPLPYVATPDAAAMPDMLAPVEGAFQYVGGTLDQTAVGQPVEFHPTGTPSPFALVGWSSWANYTVSTTVTLPPPAGGPPTGAVLIARFGGFQPHSTIMQFRAYEFTIDHTGRWRILRNGASAVVLASGSVRAAKTYHLAFTADGSLLTAAVDGRLVGAAGDSTYSSGLAGIGTLGYYPVRFDRFAVH